VAKPDDQCERRVERDLRDEIATEPIGAIVDGFERRIK
jgi:hypothetical protein